MDLSDVLPPRDYEFRMGLRRGDPAAFFRPTAEHAEIAAERTRWLAEDAARYAGLTPGGEDLVDEVAHLFVDWNAFATSEESARTAAAASPWEKLLHLGRAIEPDLLLLSREPHSPMILRAACVCFPSSWRPAEKFGQPMDFIHEPAPGLNRDLGAQIDTFLSRLQPGVGWLRTNWGLSASPERNQHPDRQLPRLDGDAELDRVWLRVERQCLTALPSGAGVLFGLRIESHRLDHVAGESLGAALRLAHALQTMDSAIARYKGLAAARGKIIARLEEIDPPAR
ncbi:MAG: heme-dependent oxidative N-demethylase subunit alpha family protein [Chthoniobacteraceae bacterium]